jgi:hypothetical protein
LYPGERLAYLQEDKPTCLFDATACALHYKGFRKFAQMMHEIGYENTDVESKEQRAILLKYMEESRLFHGNPKVYYKDRRRKERQILNPLALDDDEGNCLYVAQLQGKDGHVRHAVAIMDGLIFDSNSRYPLLLGKESLDWCCNCEGGFDLVHHAFRFWFKDKVMVELEHGVGF